jgi:conjugal transfer pilus assembly protein TraF
MTYHLSLCLLAALVASGSVSASEDKVKRGLHWYERPPVAAPEEDKPQEPSTQYKEHQPPVVPPAAELMTWHPDELSKLYDDVMKYQVYRPTPENALNQLIVKDVLRRKAVASMAVEGYVAMTNPDLNSLSQYPITNPGRNEMRRLKDDMMDTKLRESAGDYALVLLTSVECPLCLPQRNTVKYFQDKYGWSIREFNVDLVPGAREKFNVTVTPLTLAIKRGNEDYMPIAVGTESVSKMVINAYQAIRFLSGEISPTQWFTNDLQEGGFFDPDAILNKKP